MFVAEWHGGQFHTIDRMTNTLVQTTPVFSGADVAHIITSLPGENTGILSLEGGLSGSLGVFDPVTSAMVGLHSFGPAHHPHGMWLTCAGAGLGGGKVITASPMTNTVGITTVPASPVPAQVAGIDPSTDTVALPLVDCGNGCHGITFGHNVGGGFLWYAFNTYQNRIKVGAVLSGCAPIVDGDILLNVMSMLPLQGLSTTAMGFNSALPPPWHLSINVLQ